MHYFILSEKDATIKSYYPTYNFGQDHYLEVGTEKISQLPFINASRILITFPSTYVSETLSKINNSGSVFLNLYSTKEQYFSEQTTLYIYNFSGSWEQGLGKTEYTIDPILEGVTWKNRNINTVWTLQGGDYSTNYITSTLLYNVFDVKFDVTTLLQNWLTASTDISFIIKFESSLENNTSSYSMVNFYSQETNTIYPPKLEISYKDYELTGTLQQLTDTNLIITNRDMMKEYKQNTNSTIRVYGRSKYPDRTWRENWVKLQNYSLPNYVYYSLIDHLTGEIIIDFDENTKISCNDILGNYFNFSFKGIFPERYYKFKYKIINNGIEKLLNDSPTFKVIR